MTILDLPPHGTIQRHATGCSCTRCVIAAADHDNQQRTQRRRRPPQRTNGIMPSRIRHHELDDGRLSVFCWCQRAIVYVPQPVIAANRTRSCGRPRCHA